MKRFFLLLAAGLVFTVSASAACTHPCLFGNQLTAMKTRIGNPNNSNDPAWVATKADADTYKNWATPPYVYNGGGANTIIYGYYGGTWNRVLNTLLVAWKVCSDYERAPCGSTAAYKSKLLAALDSINDTITGAGTLSTAASDSRRVSATAFPFTAATLKIRVVGGAGWTPGWYTVASRPTTKLTGAIGAGDTSFTLISGTTLKPTGCTQCVMQIGSEWIVADISGDAVSNATRGFRGTTKAPHNSGDNVFADAVLVANGPSPAAAGTTGGAWTNSEPIQGDGSYGDRFSQTAVALVYDWAYSAMSPQQRTDTVNTLNAWSEYITTYGLSANPGTAYYDYTGAHILAVAMAGYGTDGDNPNAAALKSYVTGRLTALVVPAFTSGGYAGGQIVTAYNYGPGHLVRVFWAMLIAVQNGASYDIVPYAKLVARSQLYNLKPNNWQTTMEGTAPANYSGLFQLNIAETLSSILAGETEGAWIQYLITHMGNAPSGGSTGRRTAAWQSAIFYDPARTATNYTLTEPVYYYSQGEEHHAFYRSDWSSNAVWQTFRAGVFSAKLIEDAKAAGTIDVQRGNDTLLVGAGTWMGLTGAYGTPYNARSSNGWWNTLWIDDPSASAPSATYIGGQGYWGTGNPILAQSSGANYQFVKSNLCAAYDGVNGGGCTASNRIVSAYTRTVLQLPEGTVVYDRATGRLPSYYKKIVWHLNPSGSWPAVSGSTLSQTVGASKFSLTTLLPASPPLSMALDPLNSYTWSGGAWKPNGTTTLTADLTNSSLTATVASCPDLIKVPSGDQPLADPAVIKIDNELMKYASCSGTTLTFAGGGRGYRGSQAASHASGAVASAGLTYRLDVRDSADANPLKALAVIWADASTATLPAVTAVTVNNGAFVGALIAARTPRVVVLPDNDAAPALTAANFTAAFSGEGRIYVAGFTPRTVFHWKRTGTTYDVKSTTGPGYNAITADAAGMLYWTDDQSAR